MSAPALRRLFPYAAAAGVVAAIVAGLILLGPPSQARMRRLDATRIENLQRIATAVDLHRKQKGTMPESIDAVKGIPEAYIESLTDPVSAEPYAYRVVRGGEYELCASFDLESPDGPPQAQPFWSHPAGRHCFVLDADRPRF